MDGNTVTIWDRLHVGVTLRACCVVVVVMEYTGRGDPKPGDVMWRIVTGKLPHNGSVFRVCVRIRQFYRHHDLYIDQFHV